MHTYHGGLLTSLHPITKLLVYLQLIAVCIFAPVPSAIFVGVVAFLYVVVLGAGREMYVNPWYPLVLCVLAFLIAVPGGTDRDVLIAADISLRVFGVIMSSILLGLALGVRDLISLTRRFGMPEQVELMAIAIAVSLPRVLRSMRNVLAAQKSRGFVISWRTALSLRTYAVLMTPFIVAILRTALALWISLCIRPWRNYTPAVFRFGVRDLILLLASSLLWWDVLGLVRRAVFL